jgi:probable DNA metabolism protein
VPEIIICKQAAEGSAGSTAQSLEASGAVPFEASLDASFEQWRSAARDALREGWTPQQMRFHDQDEARTLELALAFEKASPAGAAIQSPHVPKAFVELARRVALHRAPQRWDLLYRVLYRLQSERNLLRIETDTDTAELHRLAHQVGRDLHKMHAFVRFRKVAVSDPDGHSTEHFIAWYAPDHRILRLAVPFFRERFAVMQWTILTPDESASWDPSSRQLRFGAGAPRESAPQADELESLWRSYYSSIFNPARLNTSAMRSEMPVRYWKNLPEMTVLPQLLQQAQSRVNTMIETQRATASAAPFVPAVHTLQVLRESLPGCRGCDLYKHATQVVPGTGPAQAALMLVGEQPGDHEDLQGSPFVGPAGTVLREALDRLGIDANAVYMTNAVKHFKFIERGKFRLHQNPRMSEISACKPWLLAELDAVQPQVVLCLGASAAKSLLGGTFALMQQRGQLMTTPFAQQVMATIHPSAVLRARDEPVRRQLHDFLMTDLAQAWKLAGQTG